MLLILLAMDLSVSSQASCSSFIRPSMTSVSVSKLNRKRSKATLSADENESEDGEGPSRKEKSLGLLCKKFLAAMGEEAQSGKDVHLESVAKKMMVEKRRIYDIVNVMEALEAMSKTNKSYYRWHGLSELPKLMAFLQQQANNENLLNRIRRVEQAMCSFTELSSCSRRSSGDIVGECVIFVSEAGQSEPSTRDRNNKNSLAQLCRRFLMVLLCNPKDMRRVSLDVASTVLIKDPESEGFEPPSRSRCRRLYDIANVLVAMGIIKKVHYLFGTKKIPLFVYSGPEPEGNKFF
uniref:E2F_TDP domain-containing protein n=1 Tax=Syphacia muris TaxID=451379 RepID=A0A0N5AIT3_9BILA